MRRTLRWLAAAALAAAALLLAAGFAALQSSPAVVLQQAPDADDIARALAILRAHGPGRAPEGTVSSVVLQERDAELVLNHAGWRGPGAATRVSLALRTATVQASLHLPANPLGRWLNVELQLRETDAGPPALAAVRVGRLPVPAWLAVRVAQRLARQHGLQDQVEALAQVVRQVRFVPGQVAVSLSWQGDSAARMAGALVPPDERQRLQAYTAHVAHWAAGRPAGSVVSLATLVGPVFMLAAERSSGADAATAAAENRAAIVVLALYVNGMALDRVLPAAADWHRPQPLQITLGGREDFPRHLLVSATLAAESTSALSRAVGLYKEVADSRGGTGFSFNDMAANRAGTRLGELASSAPHRLQATLARGVDEADFMPAWQDLPEGLAEADFKRRYGGTDTPAYAAVIAEIDRRVAALAALR